MNKSGDVVLVWYNSAFSSVEEGKHLEGLNNAMMENLPPLTTPDGSNTSESCPHPLEFTQEEGNAYQENLNIVMAEPQLREDVPIRIGQVKSGENALWKSPVTWQSKESCVEPEEETEGDASRGLNVIIISDTEEEGETAIVQEEGFTNLTPVDLQQNISEDYGTANDPASNNLLTVWKLDNVSGWDTISTADPQVVTINQQTNDKPFSCVECGGTFAYKSSLALHMRIHAGEKPFSCSECGKQFTQKSHYLRHHRLHFGEKIYKCTQCTRKQNLMVKQKVRAETPNFPCSECGACYIHKSHLVNHKKTHQDLRCFQCPHCGDFFTLRSSLINHQKVHSAENHK